MNFSMLRAAVVMAAGAAVFTALGGRVAYLQTYGREKTVRQADRQQHREQVVPARRGSVYDRNGLLMAGTLQSKLLYIDPKFFAEEFKRAADEEMKRRQDESERKKPKVAKEPTTRQMQLEEKKLAEFPAKYAPWNGVDPAMEKALTDVAEKLLCDPAELIRTVQSRLSDRYLQIGWRIDDETASEIEALNIPGLGFQPMAVRSYPMDDLASHILGGTASDGTGIDGLEARYESVLKGKNGFLRAQTDSIGRPISVNADDFTPPTHGRHLVLTIDANIQLIAEEELRNSVRLNNAKFGEVIVMDPKSGEVMAMANWPTYRTSEYLEVPKLSRTNRALVAPYEPGSTIKPFIVSPAVEWKISRLDEVFNTFSGKYVTSYGRRVTDEHGGYPELALWDILVQSSNIGMTRLGERMGDEKIWQALSTFEFGKPTGIELPGEAGGLMKRYDAKNWTKYTPTSMVQGYEVLVTPIQLARGMCAIANGGTLVRPTIVKGMVEEQGEVGRPPAGKRSAAGGPPVILSPDTMAAVRRTMADVVVRGTGKRGRSDTYNIFGKTGTAHLVDRATKRYSTKYTSSFIGSAPYENPRLVVVFVLHESQVEGKDYMGGRAAAPGAGQVLERALKYLEVPPSPPLPLPEPRYAHVLHKYDEDVKKYTEWPENVRKQRAQDAYYKARTTAPETVNAAHGPDWEIPVVPVDVPPDGSPRPQERADEGTAVPLE